MRSATTANIRRGAIVTLAAWVLGTGVCGAANAGAPDSGLYFSPQFSMSAVVISRDIVYAQRPNEGGVQITSDRRKTIEQGADTLSLTLDVGVPPNATATTPQPLVVGIHGGGFYGGSKEDMYSELGSYARAGYVVATINYRLTPNNQSNPERRLRAIRQATEDAMNAIRFLKSAAASYHIDTERIATIGVSAGGGVSLLNAVEFDTLAGTVSDDPRHSARVSAAISTGATLVEPGIDTQTLIRFDATDTPVLLFHARPTDSVTGATWEGHVLPTQARINASGNQCTVAAQPDRVHTVSLALDGPFGADIRRFLLKNLRLPTP